MKPIIVLGKGPSAFEVSPNNKVDVATANNTIWLCKNPTYAFFNDIELFWLNFNFRTCIFTEKLFYENCIVPGQVIRLRVETSNHTWHSTEIFRTSRKA